MTMREAMRRLREHYPEASYIWIHQHYHWSDFSNKESWSFGLDVCGPGKFIVDLKAHPTLESLVITATSAAEPAEVGS